eukprot:Rhum_TRINITY_DN15413_c1_g1::Rhum_TRINITY_DN15413_c1_g1_i1::g.159484::m.159484
MDEAAGLSGLLDDNQTLHTATATLRTATATLVEAVADVCDEQGGSHAHKHHSVATGYVAMGTVLVIGASFISCFGVNLQKLAHNKNDAREIDDRKHTMLMWQWWLGIVCMIMGSVMDMAALPFVPMSRVAALGASTMVANIMITPIFLGEKLTRHDLIGCLLAVCGTVLSCLFGAGKEHAVSSPCLLSYFVAPLFVLFEVVVITFLLALYYQIRVFRRKEAMLLANNVIDGNLECVWLHQNLEAVRSFGDNRHFVTTWGPQFYPTVHAVFAGTIGAQSVMFAKSVLKFLGNAVYGSKEGNESTAQSVGYTFLFLLPTIFCLWNQIHYLNVSLKIYRDALFVLPVYQALWVSMGILGGLFFYQEYREIQHLHAVAFTVGCIISMAGLIVLARRESATEPSSSPRLSGRDGLGSPSLMSARSDQETEACGVDLSTPSKQKPVDGRYHRLSLTSPIAPLPEAEWPAAGEAAVPDSEYGRLLDGQMVASGRQDTSDGCELAVIANGAGECDEAAGNGAEAAAAAPVPPAAKLRGGYSPPTPPADMPVS